MKKSVSPIFSFITRLAFIGIGVLVVLALAAASSALDASTIESAAGSAAAQVEAAREKVPTSTDDIENEYLTKEWSTFIAATPVLGPIHTFFLQQSLVFKILFNTSYEFSLTFLSIFILWLFVAYHGAKVSAASGLIPKSGNIALGIVISTLLAQLSFYNALVSAALALLRSNEHWATRIIIGVILIGVLALAWYGSSFFETYLKQRKKATQEATLQQNVAESTAFLKGVKEGQTARGNKTRRPTI